MGLCRIPATLDLLIISQLVISDMSSSESESSTIAVPTYQELQVLAGGTFRGKPSIASPLLLHS